jgi:hypothetical protein
LRLSHRRSGSVSVGRGRKQRLNDLTTAQHGELAKKKAQNLAGPHDPPTTLSRDESDRGDSTRLSSQIRPSFAANAFNRFPHNLYSFGLVQLSAL